MNSKRVKKQRRNEQRAEDRHAEISDQLDANNKKGERTASIFSSRATLQLWLISETCCKSGSNFGLRGRKIACQTHRTFRSGNIVDRLEALRSERTELEKDLAETQELLGSSELAETERRFKLDSLREMLRNELNAETSEALAAPEPSLEETVTPSARVENLKYLRRMGPINPLALQEYEALKERHDFVAEQLDDVRSGRELNKVIAAVDAEIVDVFEAAFKDVAQNFAQIFSTLFPGGQGRLTLSTLTRC